MTALAPEFLTANLSPALPDTYKFPPVAPYRHVLPTKEVSELVVA